MSSKPAVVCRGAAPPDPPRRPIFDHTAPYLARLDNYFLGGKDNFAADRELARKIVAAAPETPRLVRAGRVGRTSAVGGGDSACSAAAAESTDGEEGPIPDGEAVHGPGPRGGVAFRPDRP